VLVHPRTTLDEQLGDRYPYPPLGVNLDGAFAIEHEVNNHDSERFRPDSRAIVLEHKVGVCTMAEQAVEHDDIRGMAKVGVLEQ
jgi:hypothetical protein